MGVARIAILALAVVAAAFAALLVQGILGSKQKSAPTAQAKPNLTVAEVLDHLSLHTPGFATEVRRLLQEPGMDDDPD